MRNSQLAPAGSAKWPPVGPVGLTALGLYAPVAACPRVPGVVNKKNMK